MSGVMNHHCVAFSMAQFQFHSIDRVFSKIEYWMKFNNKLLKQYRNSQELILKMHCIYDHFMGN